MKNKITPELAFVNEYEIKKVNEVIRSKRLSLYSGKVNFQYEKNLARYFKTRFAVSVSSGTAALHSALYALNIGSGDEVIVSAASLPLTVLPIMFRGATPIFVDTKKDDLDFDYSDLDKKITQKTKAIIPVYLWGYPINIDKLKNFAKKYSLNIIEDAAQAHGSKYKDKFLGTFGDIGCFSTFESKMIATGEGGFILTNKKNITERVKFFIEHCRSYAIKNGLPEINYCEVGWNYRINELTAAIGDVQIKKLEKRIRIRKNNFNYLINGLKKINNIKLYKPDYISLNDLNYFSALFLIDENLERKNIALKLYRLGIPIDIISYNYRVCYNHPLFKINKINRCPNAESLTKRLINLPTYEALTKSDLNYILKCIHKIFI